MPELDNIARALIISIVLTLLIVTIEVLGKSKASVRACLSGQFVLYAAILGVGNSATTLLASITVADRLPVALASFFPFFYAFFGVFAFEGVLGNTNVTVFDKGVLTIQDWISKARNPAIAKALDKNVLLATNKATKAAYELQKIPDGELNAHIDRKFGAGTGSRLDAAAKASGSDPSLYKALELANNAPAETAAILKVRNHHKTNLP